MAVDQGAERRSPRFDRTPRPVVAAVGAVLAVGLALRLVAVLHARSRAESPTDWVTYCPDHFAHAVKEGKV